MLVAEFSDSDEPLVGKDIDSAFALNGFDDYCRGLVNAAVVIGKQHVDVFDGVEVLHHRRVRNVGYVAERNSAGVPCRPFGGKRQRTERHSVKTAHECEDV